MLEKRDKDRFKNALKDLKDYEIYKEVMETAMMRLQSELENLAKENTVSCVFFNSRSSHLKQELRATKAYEEKQIQKQKKYVMLYDLLKVLRPHFSCFSFSERYSKDLVSTKKRLTELETKYAQLEKQVLGTSSFSSFLV